MLRLWPVLLLKLAACLPRPDDSFLVVPSSLSWADKRFIVREINKYRNRVLPTASNMMEVTWDDAAAWVATDFTDTCQSGRSPHWKRKVLDLPVYLGETLDYSTDVLPTREAIERAIRNWSREKYHFNYETMACIRGPCSQYTQLIWATMYHVGCGLSVCGNVKVQSEVWPEVQIFVCNFEPHSDHYSAKPYLQGISCARCPSLYACRVRLCSNDTALYNYQQFNRVHGQYGLLDEC